MGRDRAWLLSLVFTVSGSNLGCAAVIEEMERQGPGILRHDCTPGGAEGEGCAASLHEGGPMEAPSAGANVCERRARLKQSEAATP